MSQPNTQNEWKTVTVEPERLRSGLWGYEEGDIAASYSADIYAEKQRLRRSFNYCHTPHVAMNVQSSGLCHGEAKAYPIVHSSYADDIMKDYRASGLKDGYTGKAVRYHGNNCIFGLPVIFRQRTFRENEIRDLARRMFAYGGLFAAEAGTYSNLILSWQQKYESPRLRKIFATELERSDLPQIQADMRIYIEGQSVPEAEQLNLL